MTNADRTQPGLSDEAFLRVAKALADANRLAILQRLGSAGDLTCAELLDDMSISQATMSHHVSELCEAGLLQREREGKCVRLRLAPGSLEAYRAELARRVPAP